MRDVSSIYIHPSYNPNIKLAFDAAVVELSTPVSGVAPIKLAGAKHDSLETPGNLATVAGWGNTIAQPAGASAGSSFPGRRREADPRLARWQDRLERPWGWVGRGCHPNRDTAAAVAAAGFIVLSLEEFDFPAMPLIVRPHVIGIAERPEA